MLTRLGINIQMFDYLIEAIMTKKWGLSNMSSDERGNEEAFRFRQRLKGKSQSPKLKGGKLAQSQRPDMESLINPCLWPLNSGINDSKIVEFTPERG